MSPEVSRSAKDGDKQRKETNTGQAIKAGKRGNT